MPARAASRRDRCIAALRRKSQKTHHVAFYAVGDRDQTSLGAKHLASGTWARIAAVLPRFCWLRIWPRQLSRSPDHAGDEIVGNTAASTTMPLLLLRRRAAAPSAAEDFKTSRRLACLNGMVSRWRGRAGPLLQRVMRAATGSRAARPSSRQCCGWLGGASARGLDVLLLRLWRNQHHPTALFSPK